MYNLSLSCRLLQNFELLFFNPKTYLILKRVRQRFAHYFVVCGIIVVVENFFFFAWNAVGFEEISRTNNLDLAWVPKTWIFGNRDKVGLFFLPFLVTLMINWVETFTCLLLSHLCRLTIIGWRKVGIDIGLLQLLMFSPCLKLVSKLESSPNHYLERNSTWIASSLNTILFHFLALWGKIGMCIESQQNAERV